jgi:glycosyltransferase involved in cell wall biosynthesis
MLDPFTIGYFSGTPTHINDFRVIYKELLSLLYDFNMSLIVVGFMEFPPDVHEFIKKKQVHCIPLVDFMELQRQVAQVDINVVPLVNNTFTNCKSEIKFFEAAIVNTITLATPIYAYETCIENKVNGFLCQEGDWYEQIARIYQNTSEIERVAKAACDYSVDNYSGRLILQKINDTYDYLYT